METNVVNLFNDYLQGASNENECIETMMHKIKGFANWYANKQPNLRDDLIASAYLALCKVFIRKNRNFNDYIHLYNYMMMCIRSALSRYLELSPLIPVPRKKKRDGYPIPTIKTITRDEFDILAPESQEMPEIKIHFKDEKDQQIADLLIQNCTYDEIGAKIGMTRPSVWERINRMRRSARVITQN